MGGVTRGLGVGFIVTLVALYFTDLQIHSYPITISIVVVTSVFFSMAGFINAVFANTFDDISIIPTFLLTPLIYLGGVFYSTALLPEFWAAVSKANPILYIVNAFRYGVLGISDINVNSAFIMIAVFTIVAWFYSLWLLNSGKSLRQ